MRQSYRVGNLDLRFPSSFAIEGPLSQLLRSFKNVSLLARKSKFEVDSELTWGLLESKRIEPHTIA
jgi:hypothetical protein